MMTGLSGLLNQIFGKREDPLVSALSDLTNAIGSLETSISNAVTVIGSLNNTAALQDLTTRVTAAQGKLDAAVTAASSGVTPPSS